jgi:hypothetical protein
MTWWLWLWIGVLVWLTVGGAWDEYRDRRSLLNVALGVAASAVCVVSVLALWKQEVEVALGRVLLPLAILAGVQLTFEVARDLTAPVLSVAEGRMPKRIAVLFVAMVFGAAVLSGIIRGLRHW